MVSTANTPAGTTTGVALRPFPYPYKAMLAICSDLDSTLNWRVYLDIMRFLNTTESTAMGEGVGLEVGNSIHFRANPPQFAYWDTDDAGREMVRTLIRSGHIDCLHSFGERIYTRDEAEQALSELQEHDCRLEVWVDHGSAITNFGPDVMDGYGDVEGHPAYHADLTTAYGIKYVWRGRTTSVTAQGVRANLGGILNGRHPAASGRTLIKEMAKQVLARVGHGKYALHRANPVLTLGMLRDGRPIYEFMRSNPHWGGVSSCDTGEGIGQVITEPMLNRLVERGGTCILYTHLGKVANPAVPFNERAVKAFRHLACMHREGHLLVTTTRRLLGYHRALSEMSYRVQEDNGRLDILVDTRSAQSSRDGVTPQDLAGLTFYVPEGRSVQLTVDGRVVENIQCNVPDPMGRSSVSMPWSPLQFPDIDISSETIRRGVRS